MAKGSVSMGLIEGVGHFFQQPDLQSACFLLLSMPSFRKNILSRVYTSCEQEVSPVSFIPSFLEPEPGHTELNAFAVNKSFRFLFLIGKSENHERISCENKMRGGKRKWGHRRCTEYVAVFADWEDHKKFIVF